MDARIAKWFDDLVEGTLDVDQLKELEQIVNIRKGTRKPKKTE